MRNNHFLAVFLLLLAGLAFASISEEDKKASLKGRVIVHTPEDLIGLRIVLDQGTQEVWVDDSGSFKIENIELGQHVLLILSPIKAYPSYRLSVTPQDPSRVRVTLDDESHTPVKAPLRVSPLADRAYFVPRQGFDFIGLLKSPMVIVIGISVLMMLMMKGLGPEAMKEMQDQAREMEKKSSEGWSALTGSTTDGKK